MSQGDCLPDVKDHTDNTIDIERGQNCEHACTQMVQTARASLDVVQERKTR